MTIYSYVYYNKFMAYKVLTRIHSNGMRTARLLTVSLHALRKGCVSAQGGVSAQEGGVCPGEGVSGTPPLVPEADTPTPPPRGQTDTC